ncbi:fimbrial assembly protein [Cellulomonas cellasea]|uniref:Fimbrial assembly protein n=2 Tax=Cellulomonas cellasea TaxID=43670 RepID=A0A0A0B9N8_9CELL|nr:fimbrial assembly protein [Cellulomonas cellasea]KGM02903.1 fimbrial assembly protein [Cellulomonas cellasea DSM 20118]GEA88803.1 hypothetical protein CCE01nite_27520 [Cellulomonas cellasea]
MTALTERARRAKPSSAGSLVGTGSLPQVNLLPPEVRAARGLKAIKKWLGVSLLGVLTLCVVAYAIALVDVSAASRELTSAQEETSRLQAEQQKYAEVPQVLSALELTRQARETGMSTEILWKGYLDAVGAVLPAEVSLETLLVTGATPVMAPAAPTDALQGPSVGQMQFTGRTATLPDTAAMIDALNGVPGLADAWVSTAVVSDSGSSYYTVSATAQITDVAYVQRFAAVEGAS